MVNCQSISESVHGNPVVADELGREQLVLGPLELEPLENWVSCSPSVNRTSSSLWRSSIELTPSVVQSAISTPALMKCAEVDIAQRALNLVSFPGCKPSSLARKVRRISSRKRHLSLY